MITVRVLNIGRPLGNWINIVFRAVRNLATIIGKAGIGEPGPWCCGRGGGGLRWAGVRVDTVEACGAICLRTIVV